MALGLIDVASEDDSLLFSSSPRQMRMDNLQVVYKTSLPELPFRKKIRAHGVGKATNKTAPTSRGHYVLGRHGSSSSANLQT
ncbi:unnamed protein product [Brassica rapa]|uniref:Uncharacterized protein n=2 Tax=Brassica TaxID=3705 RepID=A0A8D9HN96_BRACM|nr:unnamed protein product [Brassica napus]CAG7902701.1 unnamed protein product [Brassica rapa]